MKKVFTTANDVIHLFAQQTQDHARSSNCFFYGKTIYSYGHHYTLAEFIDDKTILINDRGYSATTAKHIGIVRYATRQYRQFFVTKTNLQYVHREIISLKDKLATARKPEKYINEILSLWQSINEFIDYRKDKITKTLDNYKEIKRIVKALQSDSTQYKEKLAIAKRLEEQAKKRKDAREIKQALTKFNNYEINSFRVGDKDYLRMSLDGEKVETSQGIKIYVSEASKLYKMICNGVDIKGHRIGGYVVTSINGTLKIGCHNIDMDSVHNVGKQLELISEKLGA